MPGRPPTSLTTAMGMGPSPALSNWMRAVSRPGAYGLKLIDYDGMWVKALANTPSGESGHPSYQHPARASGRSIST